MCQALSFANILEKPFVTAEFREGRDKKVIEMRRQEGDGQEGSL